AAETTGEPNPYRDEPLDANSVDAPDSSGGPSEDGPRIVSTAVDSVRPREVDASDAPPSPPTREHDAAPRTTSEESVIDRPETPRADGFPRPDMGADAAATGNSTVVNGDAQPSTSQPYGPPNAQNPRYDGSYPPREHRNGRRRRRGRDRGPRRDHPQQQQPQVALVPSGDTKGWFEPSRDGGFIRRAANSYLAESGDAWIPPTLVREFGMRKSDLIDATVGRDQRGRLTAIEIRAINENDPATAARRADFNSLPASYPERKLTLETGRPARGGAELIRRAIDLIAPIGYGQRALIVAPSRAGKTTLLHGITEGVALNHPNASLIILLVDERPEEVSEAISWGVGEVVASSFDQPAERHVEVTEMVLERARRLVEIGKDVVIVLDSLTRMARAHNTAERGTGRTLSGGLDATAMAKPKAFFGSARAIPSSSGGGSLTIIATALVETGSRMDDVIFEEFKGTGNCEIKLDRPLAEKRIYPAIDIGTSGTRREEKLFRPDQLDGVYTLRRGLSQMPPQSAMEWLIKRIAGTPSNDALLSGL
ncbi:MAG TPA: transcription termination factor Rho, partial [Gemmatimonadaceae bacterium]|nr:transcription termination factor Rho [Gemmatimonadaceae bacterium]